MGTTKLRGAIEMSGSSGTWASRSFPADDPLQAYRKKPIISHAGSDATYVGRIIIELWSDDNMTDDAEMIAITADAVDGKHAKLLDRITHALSRKMQKGNPFA
jgi:hypothetical protein